MKKTFTLFVSTLLLAFSTALTAQQCDTLGISAGTEPRFVMQDASIIVLGSAAPGYFYGTFWSPNDLVGICQCYTNSESISIAGVLSIIARKGKGPNSAASAITFSLRDMTPTGGSSFDAQGLHPNDIPGPDLIPKASKALPFADIDTGSIPSAHFNLVMFDAPVTVTGNLAISADFQAMKANADTVGFLSDLRGSAMGLDYAFHHINIPSSGKYWMKSNALINPPPDNNIAIFPILDCGVGIEEAPFFGGIKAEAYPNPTAGTTAIRYETKNTGTYALQLLSQDGKVISTLGLGLKTPGSYQADLNLVDLPAGLYLYSISDENGFRYTKTLVVSK